MTSFRDMGGVGADDTHWDMEGVGAEDTTPSDASAHPPTVMQGPII
jgi:hypothetical protein